MQITLESVIGVLSSFSIGVIVSNWIQSWLDKRKELFQKRHSYKEARYHVVVNLLCIMIDFDKSKKLLLNHGRNDINSLEQLRDELYLEWHNMVLYANDEVLLSMKEFIDNPTDKTFWKVGLAMRKDLYQFKTSLSMQSILPTIVSPKK